MEATTQTSPVHLTERAVARIREIIKAQGFDGYYFTLRVAPGGCSGLNYDPQLVREPRAGDVVWEQDGLKMATDPLSFQMIDGTEVDFAATLQTAGFKFSNPKAKASCGCGTSFTV
jgi:iron-sulfur cluster assembly accessory protein